MKGCDFLDKETLAELSAEIHQGTEAARAALDTVRRTLAPAQGNGGDDTTRSAAELRQLMRELLAAHRAVCEANHALTRLVAAQRGSLDAMPETRAKYARGEPAAARETERVVPNARERMRSELRELRRELDRLPASARRAEWEQRWTAWTAQVEQDSADEEALRREIQMLRSVVFSTVWSERLPVGATVLRASGPRRPLPSRPRTGTESTRRVNRRWAMALAIAGVLTLAGLTILLRSRPPTVIAETEATTHAVNAAASPSSVAEERPVVSKPGVDRPARQVFVDEAMMFRSAVPVGWRVVPVRADDDESVTRLENGRGEELWVIAQGMDWPPLRVGVEEEGEMRHVTRRVTEVTGVRWTYYVKESGWDSRRPDVPVFWVTAEAVRSELRRHVEGMHFREGGWDFVVVWIGPPNESAALARTVLFPFVMGMEPVAAVAADTKETPFLRGIVAEAFGRVQSK